MDVSAGKKEKESRHLPINSAVPRHAFDQETILSRGEHGFRAAKETEEIEKDRGDASRTGGLRGYRASITSAVSGSDSVARSSSRE
jgi:hypothetical protein